MKEQVNEILAATAIETLEQLAFIFGFTEDENGQPDSKSTVNASVSFSGLICGTLMIGLSQEVLTELTGNMLGIEEDVAVEQQNDALKETLNVICGNLLPKIAGKQARLNIDMPIIISEKNLYKAHQKVELTARVRLGFENGLCDLYLILDGPIPEQFAGGDKGIKDEDR